MFAYTTMLENVQVKEGISVLHLSCEASENNQESISLSVLKNLVSLIKQRSKTGWNIFKWIKYKKSNKIFKSVLREIQDCESFNDLDSILSHYNLETTRQIEIVTELEKRSYIIFALSNFQAIPRDEQPIVAGILQRLAKESPAYFSILSVGSTQSLSGNER